MGEGSHIQGARTLVIPSRQPRGWELGVSGVTAPGRTGPGSVGLLTSTLCVSGEATWSGSEFEVSFPDSPGRPGPARPPASADPSRQPHFCRLT